MRGIIQALLLPTLNMDKLTVGDPVEIRGQMISEQATQLAQEGKFDEAIALMGELLRLFDDNSLGQQQEGRLEHVLRDCRETLIKIIAARLHVPIDIGNADDQE